MRPLGERTGWPLSDSGEAKEAAWMRSAFVSIGTGKFFLSPPSPGDPLLPVIPPATQGSLYSARTFPPRRLEGHECQTVDTPPAPAQPHREAKKPRPWDLKTPAGRPRCSRGAGSEAPRRPLCSYLEWLPRGEALRRLRLVPGPPPWHRGAGGSKGAESRRGQGCGGARSRAKPRGTTPGLPEPGRAQS